MDYNMLLELATDLGYRLAMNGAETFRIEESIRRILAAYGIESEVFAIPNRLTVSIETPEGKPMTRMSFMDFIDYSLTPRVVYRILLKHCYVNKKGNQTTYISKYQNFEDAMAKRELFIKYKDHLKG